MQDALEARRLKQVEAQLTWCPAVPDVRATRVSEVWHYSSLPNAYASLQGRQPFVLHSDT